MTEKQNIIEKQIEKAIFNLKNTKRVSKIEIIEKLVEKCRSLEKTINSKTIGLNSYYVSDIKKGQRKFNLPEGVLEENIDYKIIDRKLGKIFILIK